MSITMRSELDMVGFDVSDNPVTQGQLAVRWRKLTYVDGVLKATDYHRAVIDVDTDIDATLEAVAQDLERQGYVRPPETDRGYIDDFTARAWTPEVRAAVAEDRRLAAEREAEQQAAYEAERTALAQQQQRELDEAVAAALTRQQGKAT